jgi:hypothetical protein
MQFEISKPKGLWNGPCVPSLIGKLLVFALEAAGAPLRSVIPSKFASRPDPCETQTKKTGLHPCRANPEY